jgi:hypothetical protein
VGEFDGAFFDKIFWQRLVFEYGNYYYNNLGCLEYRLDTVSASV